MKYIVEIRRYRKNVYAFTSLYAFNTLEEVKERTGNLKSDESVTNVKEYHLVHEHGRKLHSCDGFFEVNEEKGCYSNHVKISNKQGQTVDRIEYYNENSKIPKEQLQTVRQVTYKHRLKDEKEYDNYCVTYSYLEEDEDISYLLKKTMYQKRTATYDLGKNDRKGTLQAFYEHSKKNYMFDLRLYQYRLLEESEWK